MESVRRRTVWLSVLIGLSLAGLIASMAWGFATYRGLEDRLAGLPRAAIPGEVDIALAEPDTVTVFFEDPTADRTFVVQSSASSTFADLPLELTVTGPSGEPVAVSRYERDLRFDHDGRVVTAIAVLDATTPGTYNVRATGDVPVLAQISVGHIVDVGLIADLVGVVGLLVVSVVGMVVPVALMVVRRGRVNPGDEAERPLVGV